MTRNELIEKVARELCLSDGMDPDQDVIAGQAAGYENFGPRFQSAERSQNMCGNRNYMADASVAISTILAALQEPTGEMNVAALQWSYNKYGKPIGNEAAHGCWRAMLNASPLGEQSE